MQAAAEAREIERRERESLERKALHFAPLEPLMKAWNDAEILLRLLKTSLEEAQAEQFRLEKSISSISADHRYASEARDTLAAACAKLLRVRHQAIGNTRSPANFSEHKILSRLREIEAQGKAAAERRDRSREDLSRTQVDLSELSRKIELLVTRIDLARREVDRAGNEYQAREQDLSLAWQTSPGSPGTGWGSVVAAM